jgi:hypothetical protein
MDKRPDMYANAISVTMNPKEAIFVFRRLVPTYNEQFEIKGTEAAETQLIQMPLDMAKQMVKLIENTLVQVKLTEEGH